MVIASTVVGTALILIALNDVFQTLLRPSATGRLTHFVFRFGWALARRRRRSLVSSGALTVLATIGLWLGLLTVGWALLYLPHVPEGFSYSGVDPERYAPFVEALTFSMVALTTLGLGDVIPAEPWIRALSPLEALTGFALLSASVSWFMQLYPALARRRAFAIELTAMHEAGVTTELDRLGSADAVATVRSVTQSLAAVTADLVQNTEIFYFAERDARLSAARALAFTIDLRDAALASHSPELRTAGMVLERVIDELVRVLRAQYPHVRGESPAEVLDHVASSHGHSADD
ncbi:potassium channel family protein [Microbacterium sp. ARD31]|uniref:potassium channel family protein n=1 Tax=Microbacterium sp. ARD31 TaxID=2962576 RepID=UPI0028810CA0|nr:potassium channel family protein [Microbacterium sp. ARD31]MDT0184867.1 potassium channel family protein [Microbacterium sp. ARD31]